MGAFWRAWWLAAALLSGACGGGGGSGGGLAPPSNLTYGANPASYTQGFAIAPNAPAFTGLVDEFAVTPPLPLGLVFDTASGVISGTPFLPVAAGAFTVTATNDAGSTDAVVTITVEPPVPRAVYVPNAGDSTVTSFHVGSLIHSGYRVSSGAGGRAVAVRPDGAFAYVANSVSDDVSIYAIDPATGKLTEVGAPVATGQEPAGIAIDPTGNFLYTANTADGTLSAFLIDGPTGELTPVGAVSTRLGPSSVTVDPSARFVYATNGLSNDVSVFSINPVTGALVPVSTTPVGTEPRALTIARTGGGVFAYVCNAGSDDVSLFALDPITGALAPLAPPVTAVGDRPRDVQTSAGGEYLYVANQLDGTIAQFAIDPANGQLSPLVPAAAVTSPGPTALTSDPATGSLYVANLFADEITLYTIAPDGTLTLDTTVRTRSNPSDVGIGPGLAAPVFASRHAYVANRSPADSITQYAVDTTAGVELLPLSPISVPAADVDPRALALHPDQELLYASTETGTRISGFARDPATGALTVGPAEDAGASSWDLAIEPSGRFLYASLIGIGVQPYAIDAATGALTAGPAAPFGVNPRNLTVDPTGQFLYAADTGANSVHRFRITPSTGALTDFGPTPAGGPGAGTASVAVHPSGRFAYASNAAASTIAMFSVDAATGALAPLAPPQLPTGAATGPVGMALDAAGEHLYVTLSVSREVAHFTVDVSSGLLAFSDVLPTFGQDPQELSLDASGSFLAVTNTNSPNVISLYQLDPATGALVSNGFAISELGGTTGVVLSRDIQ